MLSEAEAFTIFESKSFLTLLKILLRCKRDNVIIPKIDTLQNRIFKRVKEMKAELKKKLAKSNYLYICHWICGHLLIKILFFWL